MNGDHEVRIVKFNTNYVILGLENGNLKIFNRETREWKMLISNTNNENEGNPILFIELTQQFVISTSNELCVWDVNTGEQKANIQDYFPTCCLSGNKAYSYVNECIFIWELEQTGNLKGL